MTARRSSIRCSSVATATRSDRPVPRLSNMIRRLNDARRSKYLRSAVLPLQLEVRDEHRNMNEVEGAIADDLIRDAPPPPDFAYRVSGTEIT